MFDAIRYVGTPIALVAFLAAVGAYLYARSLAARIELIRATADQTRLQALEAALRDFKTIPTDGLTKEQQYGLVVKVLEHRQARFRIAAVTFVVFVVLLGGLIGFTYIYAQAEDRPADSTTISLPDGLPLREAVKLITAIDDAVAQYDSTCTSAHLGVLVEGGSMRASRIVDLLNALQEKLVNPMHGMRVTAIRLEGKGVYEVRCSD